jgi:stress response protein YsnF
LNHIILRQSNGVSLCKHIHHRYKIDNHEAASAAATKESAVNTTIINVLVTQEEIIVERRLASKSSSVMAERLVDSKTDMKVHLSNVEIEVINEPYVEEEVMMKKKLDTESRDVEDPLRTKI